MMRVEEFWDWTRNVLASGLRASVWYDGSQPYNLAGFLNDKASRIIGWALLRQVRVQNSMGFQNYDTFFSQFIN